MLCFLTGRSRASSQAAKVEGVGSGRAMVVCVEDEVAGAR